MHAPTTATVALAYRDLLQLIAELDARAHDLGRFADEARRQRDERQESTHLEHRNEVLRLREDLHRCARTAVSRDAGLTTSHSSLERGHDPSSR